MFATPDAVAATYAGYVSANGTVAAGTGFTVTHQSAGNYLVKYPSAKFPAGYPAMTVTGWGINGASPVVNLFYTTCTGGTCTFNVTTANSAGTAFDNGFLFTIIQAR